MATKGNAQKKKDAMMKALESHLGIVSRACKDTGVARKTHYQWMKEDEAYRSKVEEMNDLVLDFAEDKLYSLVEKGDTTATIFLLKTRGKKRGYIERIDLNNEHSGKIIIEREIIGKKDE